MNETGTSYVDLLAGIKERVQAARVRAGMAANRELILLYWDIGRMVAERQDAEGWGTSVIDRLSRDIQHDFSGLKGFSPRNIRRMSLFYLSYREQLVIWPQAVAKLDEPQNEILSQALAEIGKEGSNRMLLEYALRGLEKPVGVSAYQLTRALPDDLKPSLPTVEEIENKIAEKVDEDSSGETGMMVREWAEKYKTRTGR